MTFLDNLVTWLAGKLTLVTVTMWGIQFVSTLPERVLLFGVCAIAMAGTVIVTRRVRSPQLRPFVPILAALVVFRGLYVIFPGANDGDTVLLLALAISIIQLPVWMRGGDLKIGEFRWLLSVILIPALAVVFVNGWSVFYRLAVKLHRDAAVHKISGFDLDSLAFDSENGILYASGHGASRLLAYDTRDLTRAPRESETTSDRAQSFCYSPVNQEIYVYNEADRALVFLDAPTLKVKSATSGLQMTPGDSRIVYDKQTDSVITISEGTYWGSPSESNGEPVAVIERATGKLSYTMRNCDGGLCNPGLIEIHPTEPFLYLAFPKKVVAYNTIMRRTQGTPYVSNSWVDGMTLTPDGTELLVGAPLRSAILRFDAVSLAPKGTINTVFGVRTLTVDRERNLVLAGSLATNEVDVIDIGTHKRLAKYYVAPWLRAISLDVRAGRAYVSSTEGLFMVEYTSRLAQKQPAARASGILSETRSHDLIAAR